MVKKISYILISVAILVTGYIGIEKLGYWQRSVRIFNINTSNQHFDGRVGRGQGGFGRREGFKPGEAGPGPVMRELPDSTRRRMDERSVQPVMRGRDIPESQREEFRGNNGERIERAPSERGSGNRDGHGRGGFSGSKKINLRNVVWFLAVFASFTVIVIYIDKAFCLIRNGRK